MKEKLKLSYQQKCYYILACLAVILIGAGLWYWHSLQPQRVHREHTKIVPKQFEYLTHRIDFSFSGNTWFSKKEAEKDLDELEWLLENRYSYLKRKEVDYSSALDTIRTSLGEGISRGAFALQLMKFLALFGDGHSGVGDPTLGRMCSNYLPFLIGQSRGRLVAFKADRSGFLDEKYPFLCKIEGIELEDWLKVAVQTVAEGSSQFVRHRSIRQFRYIQYLRKELGLEVSDSIEVEVESANGQKKLLLRVPLVAERPMYGPWPQTQSKILPENIGYLRIPRWMSNKQEFLDELVEYMQQFRDTKGLIIDIRGIGGGSRAPLRVLFPFFMAEKDLPKVLNIAAYRQGHRKDILDARWLYPENWGDWSSAERTAIKQVSITFQPEWTLAAKEFSDWHYFVIGPSQKPKYYHYDRPVIIVMETTNFSASDIFLGAFKGWRNITLMGTPSGGGSGCSHNYRLHNSQIRIRLSSMASFQPNGKLYDGNGIQPDVMIAPVPTDFIGKTDTVLELAIATLQTHTKENGTISSEEVFDPKNQR